ncbi:MAG: hypothetical protein ABI581_04560 [Sediminibacterium sp.]
MELEEMKTVWSAMSDEVEKQKKLTDRLVLDMIQLRYQSRLSNIRTFELAGTVICWPIAVLLLCNLNKFTSGYTLACALASSAILLIMPVLSLQALNSMRTLPLMESAHKELLAWYGKKRKWFVTVQQTSFVLFGILMVVVLPIIPAIMGKTKELPLSTWLWYSAAGIALYVLMAGKVYRYYKRTIYRMEQLLMDLEGNN